MIRELNPATLDHVERMINKRRGDLAKLTADEYVQQLYIFLESGPAFAVVIDGRCVGIFGFAILRPGVAQAWASLTDELFKYNTLWFHKKAMEKLNEVMITWNLHRVESDAIASKKTWVKWLSALGFEKEGVMRKYSSEQEDYILFAKVK